MPATIVVFGAMGAISAFFAFGRSKHDTIPTADSSELRFTSSIQGPVDAASIDVTTARSNNATQSEPPQPSSAP